MRKTVLLVLLLLAAAPSFGQSGVVAIGAGFTRPSSDLLDSVADTSLVITGYATRQIVGPVGWRAEGAFNRFSADEDCALLAPPVCGLNSPRIARVTGGMQLGGYSLANASPYAAVTVGLYNVDLGVIDSDGETDFGLGLASGVNWEIDDNWGIGLQFELNGYWPDSDLVGSQWFTETGFLAYFRF